MNEELIKLMPPMQDGESLKRLLLCLPKRKQNICQSDRTARLMAVNDLAELYVPSQMTVEIYSKLYLSMLRSLNKKMMVEAVRQRNENHKRVLGNPCGSILGGADSFSILGTSGIGKSTAIAKSIDAAGGERVIRTDNPYGKIIPCINIQCPHDCSVKSMLFSILKAVDERIETTYYERAQKYRSTTNSLIGTVSQAALNHIMLLVVDECQNISRHKHGFSVVAALTQLINSSGISICMVGMPESEEFFRSEMHLARRMVGLSYGPMECDESFINLCKTLFEYQYTLKYTSLTPELIETLYQCSGGVVGVVVALFMEAQQAAILSGKEEVTKQLLLETSCSRMKNVRGFVVPKEKNRSQTSMLKDTDDDIMKSLRPKKGLIGEETVFDRLSRESRDADELTEAAMRSGIIVYEAAL